MIQNNVPDATFIEAVAHLVKPQVVEMRRGQKQVVYGDKSETIGKELLAEPETLKVSTLSAIVAGVKCGIEGDELVYIHVASPTEVNLVAPAVGDDKQQFVYLTAKAETPAVNFGQFHSLEAFIVSVQSLFSHTEDRARVLSHVGALTTGLAADLADDGATQMVTSRKGITRAGAPVAFENPVQLCPFRTFAEVVQPISPFILRLKQTKDAEGNLTATATLFEADGGAWKREAIESIGAYFAAALPDVPVLA